MKIEQDNGNFCMVEKVNQIRCQSVEKINSSLFSRLTEDQLKKYARSIETCKPNTHLMYRSWCDGCDMYKDRVCPIKF